MDKGYVVENHLKHQSDFFKKTRDTNLLSIALDYHCLKTSQGGGNWMVINTVFCNQESI